MPEQFDYRRQLLRVMRGYLQGTAASHAEADRLLGACPPLKPFTVDDILWGSLLDTLSDRVFQDSKEYLQNKMRLLQGASHEVGRAYFNYDVRSLMSQQTQECYAGLQETLDFLDSFPFPNMDVTMNDYERRQEQLGNLLTGLEAIERREPEMVYDLVLHEVAAIVLNIHLGNSFVAHYLAPKGSYVSVHPYRKPPNFPDASSSLQWARRALNALAGIDWLYVSWHFRGKELRLSLR